MIPLEHQFVRDVPFAFTVERLREKKPSPGSLEALLVEAVKSQGPLETSSVSRQRVLDRVLASVLEQKPTDRLRARFLLRPIVAGGLLSIAGVTAASALAYRWTNRRQLAPAVVAPLAEEATALSVEAAEESGEPSAPAFAARYLEEYPRGRFRRAAELVLDRHRR